MIDEYKQAIFPFNIHEREDDRNLHKLLFLFKNHHIVARTVNEPVDVGPAGR